MTKKLRGHQSASKRASYKWEGSDKVTTSVDKFLGNTMDNEKSAKKRIYNKWYFVTKIVLNYCEKNCFSDREKLLKFKAEGWEFANFLRSLEQFIQTVKGQNNFW